MSQEDGRALWRSMRLRDHLLRSSCAEVVLTLGGVAHGQAASGFVYPVPRQSRQSADKERGGPRTNPQELFRQDRPEMRAR